LSALTATQGLTLDAVAPRAESLFRASQLRIFQYTDRLMAGLILAEWICAIGIAFFVTPYTWLGAQRQTNAHVYAAVFLGGIITGLPVALAIVQPGATATRYVIAVGQMLWSSLFIHLTGGRLETHFHIFGSLAFLAFYRDWKVLIPASLVVAADHFLGGLFWPQATYGVVAIEWWRFLEHVFWVVYIDFFLVIACIHSTREMREVSSGQAEVEALSESERRKSAEIEQMMLSLRESRTILACQSEATSEGILLASKEGKVLSFNRRYCEMWGISEKMTEDLDGLRAAAAQKVENPEAFFARVEELRHHPLEKFTDELWLRDGRRIERYTVPLRSEDGEHIGRGFYFRDVTERVRAERQVLALNAELEGRVEERTRALGAANHELGVTVADLRQIQEALRVSEARLLRLLESNIVGITISDTSGRIKEANGQFLRNLGYSREDLNKGRLRWDDLTPLHLREATEAALRELQSTGAAVPWETAQIRKDGSIMPIIMGSALVESPRGDEYIAFVLDISDRKRAEDALRRALLLDAENRRVLEATRLKSEFLANMSHELRTPLNAILGFTELVHDGETGPVTSEQQDLLSRVLTSGRHLLRLINDVLDLAKVESGKMDFYPETIDLYDLVGEVISILGATAIKSQVSVQMQIDPEVRTVIADASRLKQVLYNYVSNALKFSPPHARVAVRILPAGPEHFRIEVEDSGVGIKPEDLGRLFTEFQQLDAGLSKKYAGTGLGLVFSKRLVEAQGGSVGVRSVLGKGSVFHALLPRRTSGVPAVRILPAAPKNGAGLVLKDDLSVDGA